MNRIGTRALSLLLFVAILTSGFSGFLMNYVTKGNQWVLFPGSPHIYNGWDIAAGVVVDRDGVLLLDLNNGREYSNSLLLRKATVHWLGDRNGNVGTSVLAGYAGQMAGYDLCNGVYHYGQNSGVAELTLSGKMQIAAWEALGDRKGTVAVLNYKTGQILCAVTSPNFDPDDAQTTTALKGLYVNRFIQSAYTPGSIFKIVTLAAALENDPKIVGKSYVCTGSYEVGGGQITCEMAHGEQTVKEAFCNSCNCAFAQITLEIGAEKMQAYSKQFGVLEPISFDGITTVSGNFQATDADPLCLAWSGIGQYQDLVNPCAFLAFMGAVANGGRSVNPYLMERISVDGSGTYRAAAQTGRQIFSPQTAAVLQAYLQNNVQVKYGVEHFLDLLAGAKTGTAEVSGQNPNAMLAGFINDDKMSLAFVVCVEDAGYGEAVCIPIISKVLAAGMG